MKNGFVYFITREPGDRVKIGFTTSNPHARRAALQTGCPDPLDLVAYVPATDEEERRLHETFRELRVQGEWFYCQQKLADFVWYLDGDCDPRNRDPATDRERFEDGLWDVVITGYDYPNRTDLEGYAESGDGSLWLHLFPEEGNA